MSEFVSRSIGARQHSWPEPRRNGAVGPFARNYAYGPASETAVAIPTGAGMQIAWGTIAVPADPPTNEDVPITPIATGYVRVTGILCITNVSGGALTVGVAVQINGVTFPVPLANIPVIGTNSTVEVPIDSEIDPSATPVGTTKNIEIRVAASGVGCGLIPNSSILDIQEVGVPTG